MFGLWTRRTPAAPNWLNDLPSAIGDGVYALDHRFRFTFINPGAATFWGQATAALMNRPIWDAFPTLVGGLMHDAHLGAVRDRTPTSFEAPAGIGGKWVAGSAHPHRTGLLVLFRDVTERRRRVTALHECQSRLTALFEQSGVGLGEFHTDGRLRNMNDRFCQSFSRSRTELMGIALDRLLPDGGARLRRVRETGMPDTAETQVLQARRASWLETTLSIARDHTGEETGLLLVVHDLTHRRAAEEALRSLNASLEARVTDALAERAGMEESLRQSQKMEALGQLAGGVAHDFNNVLQAINGGARLIQRKPNEPETVARLAGLIVDAADRGAAVTRRLLSFARRDALQAEPVDAGPMLADLADVLAHTLGRRIAVRAVSDHRLISLADRGQLETVLVNLATNARDAMPDGGTLTLEAVREVVEPGDVHPAGIGPGEYARFSATDTGTGMDTATLSHATEPFFTTKPRGKGTGLGLSMARGFAEQSGGGMTITSSPGEGTRVTLWLPVAGAGPRRPVAESIAGPRPRVLVVDDDAHVRDVLAEELRQLGCDVVAYDGATPALAWLRDGGQVDLLVSDLSMPGTDGLTLIREAQRDRPGLPALLLTGYAGDGLEVAIGSTAGARTALLRKPVRGAELAAALNTLIHPSAAP